MRNAAGQQSFLAKQGLPQFMHSAVREAADTQDFTPMKFNRKILKQPPGSRDMLSFQNNFRAV
jgi:hypothetical protein